MIGKDRAEVLIANDKATKILPDHVEKSSTDGGRFVLKEFDILRL